MKSGNSCKFHAFDSKMDGLKKEIRKGFSCGTNMGEREKKRER